MYVMYKVNMKRWKNIWFLSLKTFSFFNIFENWGITFFCTFLKFFPNLNQDAPKLINHWNNPNNYLIHLFGGLKLLTQGEFEKCTNKTLFFTPDSNQTQYLTLPLIFPQSIISWILRFSCPKMTHITNRAGMTQL